MSESTTAYSRFAEIYDEAYDFVDYAGAFEWVRRLIGELHPEAKSVLEIACGTGRYLELFAREFDVEGVDCSPEMLQKAAARVPGVPLHEADMTSFDTGRQYDVVCCLFRSIAYARTTTALHATIASMARHLSPRGLLLIEPFFTPETYWEDRVTLNEYKRADLALAWMYVSERADAVARLRIHCLVGRPSGVEHFVEVHELGLFSPEDFKRAFASTGLTLDYDHAGPGGIGMYIGRRT